MHKTSIFPRRPEHFLFMSRPAPRPGDISIGSDGEKGESQSPLHTPTDSERGDLLSPKLKFSGDPQDRGDPPMRRKLDLASPGLKELAAPKLSFSIDQILRPDFGPKRPSSTLFAGQKEGALPALRIPQPCPAAVSAPTLNLSPSGAAPSQPPTPGPTPDLHSPATKESLFPAWVYCTRYSDRPSSGPRCRRTKKEKTEDEKRPRTAFTSEQLSRLKAEFHGNRYLTEKRRQDLAKDLGLKESQVKIWFQNKRAKIKKQVGSRHPLAMHLMAQGLYNHTTTVKSDDDEDGMH